MEKEDVPTSSLHAQASNLSRIHAQCTSLEYCERGREEEEEEEEEEEGAAEGEE